MTLRLGRPAVTQLASWFGAKPYPPEDRDEAQDEDRGEAGEDGEAAEARPKVPDPDETRVYLGAGGIVGPEFEGSEDYEVSPFPLIRVENLYGFSLRGPAIDYELIRERFKTTGLGLRAGPSVGVDFGRDEDDNDALRGLGDIDTSVLVGGFARVNFGPVLLRVSGGQDVADGHGGALVESRFGVYLPIGDLRVSPGISATWVWITPGSRNASCTIQRGQVPPKRAKLKPPPLRRFDTLPALSTRMKKNGTPRAPERCSVLSRWQTCSKLAPKRCCSRSRS